MPSRRLGRRFHPVWTMSRQPDARTLRGVIAAQSTSPREAAREERRDRVLRERYGLLLAALVVLFLVQGIAPGGPWQEVVITALSASTLVLALQAGEASLARSCGWPSSSARSSSRRSPRSRSPAPRTRAPRGSRAACWSPSRRRRSRVGVDPRPARARAHDGPGGARRPVPLPDDRHGLRVRLRHDRQPGRRPRVRQRRRPRRRPIACTSASRRSTTVGYGDVLTRSDLGHTLAVTEALVGQIYLVTVVALLVSDLGSRRTRSPRTESSIRCSEAGLGRDAAGRRRRLCSAL